MTTAIISIAILAVLLSAIGFTVFRKRGVPAERAHDDASGYVPTLMVLCCWWGPAFRIGWRSR